MRYKLETTMLELYHHGSSACAAKVRITLDEKNIPWKGHYIDTLKGEQFHPDYAKLNPKMRGADGGARWPRDP